MKTISLIFTAITVATMTASAVESGDTVATVDQPVIVRIISSGNNKKVTVEGCAGQPDYRLEYESSIKSESTDSIDEPFIFNIPFKRTTEEKKRNNPSIDCFNDIYAGAVIPTESDRGFSRTGWEIGMLNLVRADWRLSSCGTYLSLGIGWQYRHITIGDGMMLDRDQNGTLLVEPIAESYHKVKSSLKSFAIQIPLSLSQKIYKAFTIEVGGVAVLNTYTTGNVSWHEDNVSSKMSVKGLHQRLLTVDAFARIGWRGNMAFYVRYSPMSQFKPHHGPQYNSVAVGMSIGF